MPYACIEDGWYLPCTINGSEFHPTVTFTYRPLTPRQIARFHDQLIKNQREKPDETLELAEIAACKLIAEHVKEWDLLDSKGKPWPLTDEAVEHLEPHLSGAIFKVLQGRRTSDDPKHAKKTDGARIKNSSKGSASS